MCHVSPVSGRIFTQTSALQRVSSATTLQCKNDVFKSVQIWRRYGIHRLFGSYLARLWTYLHAYKPVVLCVVEDNSLHRTENCPGGSVLVDGFYQEFYSMCTEG